jgi:hypothetical protein
MPRPDESDELLSQAAAAALLSMSARSLERWRQTRKPGSPPFIKMSGRMIRYSRRALLAWLSEKTIAA